MHSINLSSFVSQPGEENHNCYPDEHYVQTYLHVSFMMSSCLLCTLAVWNVAGSLFVADVILSATCFSYRFQSASLCERWAGHGAKLAAVTAPEAP